MIHSHLTVSEAEAAERLEELITLVKQGHEIIVVADDGQLIKLEAVHCDDESTASTGIAKT